MHTATPFWAFFWEGTPYFSARGLYYIDWRSWPIKPFKERKLLKKYSDDNGAMGTEPWGVFLSFYFFFCHWICTDCNKNLIYWNHFCTNYYCYYLHHYNCCCRFYYNVVFVVAISAIVLVLFLPLLLVLIRLLPPSLSFL